MRELYACFPISIIILNYDNYDIRVRAPNITFINPFVVVNPYIPVRICGIDKH